MKEIKKKLKSPLFYFHGNCGKVCPTDSDFFLAYLVPLDVVVTGNIKGDLNFFGILFIKLHETL
jgi:hypothetical protein